jgi:hypothetical protein
VYGKDAWNNDSATISLSGCAVSMRLPRFARNDVYVLKSRVLNKVSRIASLLTVGGIRICGGLQFLMRVRRTCPQKIRQMVFCVVQPALRRSAAPMHQKRQPFLIQDFVSNNPMTVIDGENGLNKTIAFPAFEL